MPAVIFRHGETRNVDHTPSGAVAAGAVILAGNYPHIAHLSIEANRLGAIAARGGAYDATAGASITAGADVYWNVSAGKVNKLASASVGDKHIGRLVGDSAAANADEIVRFLHEPNGTAKSE